MTVHATTHITFQHGTAESALDLYADVFDGFTVDSMDRWGPDEDGAGTIKRARFSIAGQEFTCGDSPIEHEWGFTPAISLWVDCSDADELGTVFARLSADGEVFMPLDDYGFSDRYGWVGDRFGVTWQLNLPR